MTKEEFKKLKKEQMIIAFNQLKDDYHELVKDNEQLFSSGPWMQVNRETKGEVLYSFITEHMTYKEVMDLLIRLTVHTQFNTYAMSMEEEGMTCECGGNE